MARFTPLPATWMKPAERNQIRMYLKIFTERLKTLKIKGDPSIDS